MIRALILFITVLVITTAGMVYVKRDSILPLTASFIAQRITGIDDLKIGSITADPSERTLTLTNIHAGTDQSIQTLRITPDLITISDAALHINITQADGVWQAEPAGMDCRIPLYPRDDQTTPAVILPTIVLNAVTVNLDTPYGPIQTLVNGQYGQKQLIGTIAANAISLRHEDTVINGLTTTINSAADTGFSADFNIATLTQGQTPLTNLTGRVTSITTTPHITMNGTLNTEFAFDAVGDVAVDGPVQATIRILNAASDVGRAVITTNWKQSDKATLDVSNLSLRTLPTLTGWQGLQADGRLSGQFKLTRASHGWIINSGRLKGGQGGFIAYTPDIYPGFLASADPRLEAVREILKHLNISDIDVTASGDLSDDMRLGIALKGLNPDYSPRPVHLNLNFEGTAWPLVQSLLRPLSLLPNINTEKDETK